MRILCIDFDDVIFKTKQVVEPLLETINYKSSVAYLRSLEDPRIDEETKKEKFDEYLEQKDRVLEEVDDKYKGCIDYDQIFSTDYVYPNTFRYIQYLLNSEKFDKVYILSHCNVEREVIAKRKFIERHWPGLELIAVPFHIEKFEEGKKRVITSKADYLKKYLGLDDLSLVTLVDDSARNGRDWVSKNGTFIWYSPTGRKYTDNQTIDLLPMAIENMGADYPRLGRGR